MEKKNLEKYSNFGDCPVRNVLDRFGDKWSILILLVLSDEGTMRFGALNKSITDISQKVLTSTLRTLEADGLIERKIYPEIPPKVEYTLTHLALTLIPHIRSLTNWAKENFPTIRNSREKYYAA